MNWIDYREALGISISDENKAKMLCNKIVTIFETIEETVTIEREESICKRYFRMVGETPYLNKYYFSYAGDSVISEKTIVSTISRIIAFINSCKLVGEEFIGLRIKEMFIESLDELALQYDIREDDDGIFLFPKGAEELDDELISMPYEWLKKYPKARDAMTKALLQYSQGNDPSTIADLFRKALETFYQEFFGKSNSLEKLKSDFGEYLKDKGVPKEISGNLETVLQLYTKFNNNYAKHHDDTSKDVLEFIMYQTGNLIRLIITLEK